MKYVKTGLVLLITFNFSFFAVADEDRKLEAVTAGGTHQAQQNLLKQDARSVKLDPNTGLPLKDANGNFIYADDADTKFNIQNLQKDALEKSSQVETDRIKQFELGADIIPFIAPWITQVANDCVNRINPRRDDNVEESFAECTRQAVNEFKNNPTAFIQKLPEGAKKRLETLVQEKINASLKPANARP